MKEINYNNQHEIGFDIDCLPEWASYIAMDDDEDGLWWYFYPEIPESGIRNDVWVVTHGEFGIIPTDYAPKNFTGSWEESLFKINRENLVNYNGTAI